VKEIQDLIHSSSLTKAEMMIAEYILNNSGSACFMTSTQIAEEAGVSESTVIRFSRKLGYDGFMTFRRDLQKGYQDKVLSISSAITIPAQRLAKSTKLKNASEYMHEHYKNAAKNIEAVLSENSISTFEEAADLLIKSKTKYLLGTRSNACQADFAVLYLTHMLPNIIQISSPVCSPFDMMCNISEEDCLLVYSFPRYSSIDELTCQMAKDSGAKIIIITDKPSGALAKFADILLTVPVDSNAFFNSLVAVQFVNEALLDTISHKVNDLDARLEKIDKYLDVHELY
jgi:DNA-binding MurR/RpiR family transcriptional regulator